MRDKKWNMMAKIVLNWLISCMLFLVFFLDQKHQTDYLIENLIILERQNV